MYVRAHVYNYVSSNVYCHTYHIDTQIDLQTKNMYTYMYMHTCVIMYQKQASSKLGIPKKQSNFQSVGIHNSGMHIPQLTQKMCVYPYFNI